MFDGLKRWFRGSQRADASKDGPGYFYIEYFQDAGYAGMGICLITHAQNRQEAIQGFSDRVRAAGYCCTAHPSDILKIEYLGQDVPEAYRETTIY